MHVLDDIQCRALFNSCCFAATQTEAPRCLHQSLTAIVPQTRYSRAAYMPCIGIQSLYAGQELSRFATFKVVNSRSCMMSGRASTAHVAYSVCLLSHAASSQRAASPLETVL